MKYQKGIILTKKSRGEEVKMKEDFEFFLEKLKNISPLGENEKEIRELVCTLLPISSAEEREKVLLISRQKLRKTENAKRKTKRNCIMKAYDLGSLLESVSRSADIILADKGKTLSFDFHKEECDSCPSLIIDAFLNLISNSAKFSSGDEIYATLETKGDSKILTVENKGFAPCGSFSGEGIGSASRTARLHGGRLFYSSGRNTVKASMSFPVMHRAKRKYEVPLFSDFLADEFSQVQIGLSDVF